MREQPQDSSIDPTECSKIFEMHGPFLDTLCTPCSHLQHNPSLPTSTAPHSDLPSAGDEAPASDLPHCGRCGSLLRPGVVWFEELPRHSREIWEVISSERPRRWAVSEFPDQGSWMLKTFDRCSPQPRSHTRSPTMGTRWRSSIYGLGRGTSSTTFCFSGCVRVPFQAFCSVSVLNTG